MPANISSDNKYAQILKAMGKYVVNVEGVDWFDQGGFMIPAYLPHCTPHITGDLARQVVKVSGRAFAKWDSKFGKLEKSEWWWVLKRGEWNVDDIKERDKRYKIRKGKKNFSVRPLTAEEILNDCHRVTRLAAARYKTNAQLETPETFKALVKALEKVPGVIEYLGCFSGDTLVSFAENHIQNNAVFCNIIRHDPAFLKKNSSYALINGLLAYYLNEKKFDYVSNGWRNVYHETEFHDHIISVFGYTKEYSKLNIVYSAKLNLAVKLAYPFRKIVEALSNRKADKLLDKVAAMLKQEHIRRACQNL